MRRRIYEIIEVAKEGDRASDVYDTLMLCLIILSILPLAFKGQYTFFAITDIVTTVIFIVDYFLRWITADHKQGEHKISTFARYPFTPWAIIDLISILPTITILNSGLKLFRLPRILRAMRVFRVFKAMRYSKSMMIIAQVIKKSRDALLAVMTLAIGYVLISALIIYNVEPDSFNTFFDAFYWATVSLTTVGYGDIYPVTTTGRLVTMISSVFGIAVVAMPAGIITAGYMKTINDDNDQ